MISKKVDLPCQACYLHKQIIPAHYQAALPTEGTQCAICLDDLTVDAAGSDPETMLPNERIAFVKPFPHFSHKGCILTWHKGNRPEHDTCPVCRRRLFVADPLIPEQIRQFQENEAGQSVRTAPSAVDNC